MNKTHHLSSDKSFPCGHCDFYVSTDPMIAGVQSRNHCPHCLWSKHVDLSEAGDRLAVCKGMMPPIGLTLKRTRKKYGMAQYGELMLIHQCEACGKISVNRIAADDDADLIFKIYQDSFCMHLEKKAELEAGGIHVLDTKEGEIVRAQLFGRR